MLLILTLASVAGCLFFGAKFFVEDWRDCDIRWLIVWALLATTHLAIAVTIVYN